MRPTHDRLARAARGSQSGIEMATRRRPPTSGPPIAERSEARARLAAIASVDRSPCFVAFHRDRSFPSGVRGPVERSHGLVRRIDRRSDARPRAVSR